MPLQLIAAPVGLVVSVADAKSYMRVDHSDDDTLIEGFIGAATAQIDGRYGTLQRALLPQTWDYTFAAFPDQNCDQTIDIPLPPLVDVVSISYTDAAGDIQTYESGEYEVDTNSVPGRVRLVNNGYWPTANEYMFEAVRIRFIAGYPDGVPETIKLAIKIMVADMYENRESSITGTINQAVEMPTTAERLLNQYRVHAFA